MSLLKIIVTVAFLFLIHIKDGQSCQSSPTTYIVAHDCYRDEDCAGGRCVFISSGNKCQSGQREGNRISVNAIVTHLLIEEIDQVMDKIIGGIIRE